MYNRVFSPVSYCHFTLFLLTSILLTHTLYAQVDVITESMWVDMYGNPTNLDLSGGHSIPNFSYAGYMHGERAVTEATSGEWAVIAVFSGCRSQDYRKCIRDDVDDAQRINEAIKSIPAGQKTIIQLDRGPYILRGSILLNKPYTVLRGNGTKADRDPTVLYSYSVTNAFTAGKVHGVQTQETEDWNRWVIQLGTGEYNAWNLSKDNTSGEGGAGFALIGDEKVGSTSIRIASDGASQDHFKEGDRVMIVQEANARWRQDVDCGGLGDGWCASTTTPALDHVILRELSTVQDEASGRVLVFQVPLFYDLKTTYNPRVIRLSDEAYNRHIIEHVGLEDLHIRILATGYETRTNRDHPGKTIVIQGAENAWLRNVTTTGFSWSAVQTQTANKVTIDNVHAYEPNWVEEEGFSPRPYVINIGGWSQQVLVKDSYVDGSHLAYTVNGGPTSSGVVFLRNSGSQNAGVAAESHQRFALGLLWDNHREINIIDAPHYPYIGRLGDSVSGHHGWLSGNSVMWNFTGGPLSSRKILNHKPPTAQHWVIGSSFETTGDIYFNLSTLDENGDVVLAGSQPQGISEHVGLPASMVMLGSTPSLYEAQLMGREVSPETEITYLSDLTPLVESDSVQLPSLDLSTYGSTLKTNETVYARGLGVHANTTLIYDLDGIYDTFKADIGLPDEVVTEAQGCTACASVDYQVYVDGALKWDSRTIGGEAVRPATSTLYAQVDVRGATELKLVVTDAGDGSQHDHAVWADARLLKTRRAVAQ